MRVVHVANAYTPRSGGIRTTVHALGHGYQAAGHEFVLVVPGPRTSDEDLPWGRRITLAGPKVPGAGGYRLLADLRKLRTILHGLEPDRLEVSDRLTLRGLGRWARSAGVPSTVIAHERVDGILRAFTPLGARGAQLAADRHNATTAEHFDRVVTTTRFAGQEFARIDIPTHHVPLGVDLEQFRPLAHGQGGFLCWCCAAGCRGRSGPTSPSRRCGCCTLPGARPDLWSPGPARSAHRCGAGLADCQWSWWDIWRPARPSPVCSGLRTSSWHRDPWRPLGWQHWKPWPAALPSWQRARRQWPSWWEAELGAAQDPNPQRSPPLSRDCWPCLKYNGGGRRGRG